MNAIYLLCILFISLTSAFGSEIPKNIPARLSTQGPRIYKSDPKWSDAIDFELQISHGSIRVFNASSYLIDINLLAEMLEIHGVPWKKSLELRLFKDNLVVPNKIEGFSLSQTNGKIGLTVSTDRIAWALIPTGWASKAKTYASSFGFAEIRGSVEELITMCIAHELLVHAIARAAEEMHKIEDKERLAEYFEREVHRILHGRTLVKK